MIHLNTNEKATLMAALHFFDMHRNQAIKETEAQFKDGGKPLFTGEIDELIHRLVHEPEPVGGFTLEDYRTQAESDGFDLTDEQLVDFMNTSRRKMDAEIGINWEVISLHLAMWADDNNIEKSNTEEG